MWEKIVESLVASGPLALILAGGCLALWRKLRAKEIQYEGDPKDPEKTPGLLAVRAKECQDREDEIREHYEAELKKERDENKALYREINATLKKFEEEK